MARIVNEKHLAYHESGHVVQLSIEGFCANNVTISPNKKSDGRTTLPESPYANGTRIPYLTRYQEKRIEAERFSRILLAGETCLRLHKIIDRCINLKEVAFEKTIDELVGTGTDLLECIHLFGKVFHRHPAGISYAWYLTMYKRSSLELLQKWEEVEAVVVELLRHKKLSGDELTDILEHHKPLGKEKEKQLADIKNYIERNWNVSSFYIDPDRDKRPPVN